MPRATEEPGARRTLARVEAVRVLEHVQKHFLRHVLSHGFGLGHREGEPIDVVAAPPIKLDESVLGAFRHLREQEGIVTVVEGLCFSGHRNSIVLDSYSRHGPVWFPTCHGGLYIYGGTAAA